MGASSSSTAKPTIAESEEGPFISKQSSRTTNSGDTKMSVAFSSHSQSQDDLGHDTLMGLQELDSHLSIFEETADPGLETSLDVLSEAPAESFLEISEPPLSSVAEISKLSSPRANSVHDSPHIKVEGTRPKVNWHLMASDHPVVNGAARLIHENVGNSTTSSSISVDASDISPAASSFSSKATSPTGFGSASVEPTSTLSAVPATDTMPRPQYDVRPKVSIPSDLAPQEYARQCIAAAESSRLNPYSLQSEEHAMLREHLTHSQVTTYINIRNGILRLWTRNPLIAVTRDEALGCARDARWFDVANLCYEWLARRGYINYGCLENIPSRYPPPKRSSKRKRKTIVVIGAGMSGLGCARQLESLVAQFEDRFRDKGEDVPKVVLLEGRDRVGGRVHSRGLKSGDSSTILPTGSRCTAEMGGMIITGFDRGNPLNILVRGQLALPYHKLRPTTTIYDVSGEPVDQHRDQLAEKWYNDVLERVSDYKFKISQPKSIEGDKDLIDAGRDAHSDNTKTMKEVEEGAALSSAPEGLFKPGLPSSSLLEKVNAPEVIPVSSDRLTGKAHLEPGVPAVHTAAYKARVMGLPVHDGVQDSQDLDLAAAVTLKSATLGSVMDEALEQFKSVISVLPLDLRLVNWHIANLEYSNAINYNEMSLGGWDVDAGNEWEGKHTMIIGGYQQVPRGLLHCPQPLNVRKRSVVKRITYSAVGAEGPARIECEDGHTVEADYVVSSIPLGVLKQKNIEFEPALPEWKTGAIERLGFGILNKVVLVYKEAFWDESRDIFGVLREPIHRASLNQKDYSTNRGRFFQWFNVTNTSGLPTLLALMAGDAAFQTDASEVLPLVEEATAVLRSVFGTAVPQPVEAIVTRWGQDKFARGSYSYSGPNFRPDDYEVMAKPIGNLFFAGEHTCGTHPATVHGAYISGLRAASEVLETMIGPISYPVPLLQPKETAASLKRKASTLAEQQPKDPKLARLEAYEIAVWNAIYTELGDRPYRPSKISANPYILYGKDKFEDARKKCEEGRRPGKGKPVPNEVRIMLAKMWKDATEDDKKPYNDSAMEQKRIYAAAMAEFNEKATKWDKDALAFRKIYEVEHPSVPGPKEKHDDDWRRDRRAKRLSGYAEDSGSDIEA